MLEQETGEEAGRHFARRHSMVERQLRGRGIRDERVLAAMESVPRHVFVPHTRRHQAYDDCPLPIGEGQTISQPLMVALMCELAHLRPGDRVLDVGAGSGYQAAVLGQLAQRVIGIELLPELAERARERIRALGYDNVEIVTGDGSRGYPGEAPYQAILVAAQTPTPPPALVEQLVSGGRLVLPVGPEYVQTLTVVHKNESALEQETHGHCAFVPLCSAPDGGSP